MLAERIQRIRQTLPEGVRLIAVSKTVPAQTLRQAYEAGIRDFGESRVQEALPKQDALADLEGITWHFIGNVQTNKAKAVVERFDWLHSLDRLKLARELHKLAERGLPQPKSCLQVKILPDPNKSGWHPEELRADLPELEGLEGLNVCGLMSIAPFDTSPEQRRDAFARVGQLAEELRSRGRWKLPELSMGMSDDYREAIAAGATMVRLGRILFGDRPL